MTLLYKLVLVLFSFSVCAKVPLLFIFEDAGETLALAPVLEELRLQKKDFSVLAMGTAAELTAEMVERFDLKQKCEIEESMDTISTWRSSLGTKFRQCFLKTQIVMGVNGKNALAVAKALNHKKQVWGYDDAFSFTDGKRYQAFTPYLGQMLVPSQKIKKEFAQCCSKLKVKVVGQPSLEEWREASQKVDKQKIIRELVLDPARKVLVYAGGYGEGYAESFALFAESVSKLEGVQILLSLHPKVDGALEREILSKYHVEKMVKIIPKTIRTKEVAVLADLVVVHESSVGVQALFMGKKILYLDLPGNSYSDLALEEGWAKQLTNVADFIQETQKILKGPKSTRVFSVKGVPLNSKTIIVKML